MHVISLRWWVEVYACGWGETEWGWQTENISGQGVLRNDSRVRSVEYLHLLSHFRQQPGGWCWIWAGCPWPGAWRWRRKAPPGCSPAGRLPSGPTRDAQIVSCQLRHVHENPHYTLCQQSPGTLWQSCFQQCSNASQTWRKLRASLSKSLKIVLYRF